ncbi:hypothetical protein, partial [Streptomyces sp. H27-D2]|uniref:hypothetical protein n=1 Tax=Streptomyces sp. H27-D2 TaxID=3046304 RepID=UPI002DBAFDF9
MLRTQPNGVALGPTVEGAAGAPDGDRPGRIEATARSPRCAAHLAPPHLRRFRAARSRLDQSHTGRQPPTRREGAGPEGR